MSRITKLRKLLLERDITQIQLVRMVNERYESGITKEAVSLMCKGVKRNVHTDTILKICSVLDCTPNDIIDRDGFLEAHPQKKAYRSSIRPNGVVETQDNIAENGNEEVC